MNLEKETPAIYKLENEQVVDHIVGETYTDKIKDFEAEIDYEIRLKKKIEKIFDIIGFSIYFALAYYCFTHSTKPHSLLALIFSAIILLFIFAAIYDPIANLFNKFILKVIFKSKIEKILEKRKSYFSSLQNQYELVKPLAYLSATPVGEGEEGKYFEQYNEYQQGKNPIHTSYKIKSNLNYLRNELLNNFENEDYDKAIETYRRIYYQSRREVAYVSNIECSHSYYSKLKDDLNIK